MVTLEFPFITGKESLSLPLIHRQRKRRVKRNNSQKHCVKYCCWQDLRVHKLCVSTIYIVLLLKAMNDFGYKQNFTKRSFVIFF